MAISIIPGIPQFLFLQEATPTATSQGQLWVKISTNQLYQADSTLNWNAVVTSPTASAGASLVLIGTATADGTKTTMDFTSVGDYDNYLLMGYAQSSITGSNTANKIYFNADTTAGHYHSNYMIAVATGLSGAELSDGIFNFSADNGAVSVSSFLCEIGGGTTANHCLTSNFSFTGYTGTIGCRWTPTASTSITSISLVSGSGNWKSGSKVCLYGVKST